MDGETKQRFEENEKRISILESMLSSAKKITANTYPNTEGKMWYKPGSTVGKLVGLINEGFFDTHKTLNEVTAQFATKDYHFRLSDLTLPTRQLVRHGMLRREKIKEKWAYIKIN
ncbi:MAG TPA: hypothetical protein VND15_00940 [Candidatus Acidoferrales bacterium]|nr:hypothetical protein [Candidatus Acidoferrales bacterium]